MLILIAILEILAAKESSRKFKNCDPISTRSGKYQEPSRGYYVTSLLVGKVGNTLGFHKAHLAGGEHTRFSPPARIITGDETWVRSFTPDTKIVSMTHQVSHSAGEVKMTVFLDAKGGILIDFFTSGTINAARYCDTLTKFKSTIRRKRPVHLSRGVLFLDDNARPHTARDTK
ncbi:hypothetical protein AVEN_217840-1 [Araneus ventricosus]|uniref:Mariner Mos1 transposase n=1 Tax=Araneus ventricosus TaxID=182803 RepID=A0A4Y2UGH9_ARAVE|nr:hypothetical protein AVEN_217840-1 [Araneus ventricosus]